MSAVDKDADDMAHDHFKANFNKLFGAKPQMRKRDAEREKLRREGIDRTFPTTAMRKEYQGADEGGKTLMLLEVMLEALAAPKLMEKRAALAKLAEIQADNRAMRAQLDVYKVEIASIERDFAEIMARDQEARARMFKARPFALDVNDPRAIEFALDAVRRNPGLLDKIAKPH